MLSDEWLPRYRLLVNFNKVEREWNGNAYDRGDYKSSFALRAVELKMIEEIFPISVKIKKISPKQKALGPLPKKAEKIHV